MKYDQDKVDEMTLALLYLTTTEHEEGRGARAWRGFDSHTIDRLHTKGWIDDPKTKALSLHLTDDGFKKSQQWFLKWFGQEEK
jgi:hypothetical protein